MGRRPLHVPLRVYLNNRLVGQLSKESSGAVRFRYEDHWLARRGAFPVSLSLPLREDAYRGEPVNAVFENLLPDSDALRRRVAEKVGARGIDAYSLLARIGRDCVGALQFIAGDDDLPDIEAISGEAVDDGEIEKLLKNLAQAPLGLSRDDDFRISVAGAQEKTALLRHDGRWLKPHGTTPTTHIFKTQIGTLPNGIDLTNSVENEFYCLALAEAFGLPVNTARIATFGKTKALAIERFDRRWTESGRLIRLPQEDCCQALSVPPTLKYQHEGGPGMAAILNLLKGSDTPAEDQKTFLAAQMLFWILGATDGHAKNFSVFLAPGGGYQLTPLYDILTAQPSLDLNQITRKQMKLAMAVGTNRNYRIDQIHPRHFLQTAAAVKLPDSVVNGAMAHIAERGERAFTRVTELLPRDFPEAIHASVSAAALPRLRAFEEAVS
ncbi:type II toxin-antitoxin system HipA family toxin [Mesorhizobium sp. B2-3-14]|uniref:type II toxin-antitoxin system HipA family toxin n=1 Tax=unclassified Mesorhizobium TaxID=325217 RepID=UPI001129D6E2|nr:MULTISPECIES: type II toxin-antitoxin system HipA family toxin [unclassified Mesorhizobium]MBZ9931812.1 type II toxin-antitoxin system HipA family toxin [Mesorhizobium sp. BR1-1-5]MBZ9905619.1 type II toxin-antitoxin system HipA family toxin [Mesorhizobium sp. BR115XR7A]TPK73870.1 type II toxin-antitoxin system HipA family toxin [Mesorhizobium sp. B2-4-18]TPL74110.1 type II toxin-antitoxin system HipA family toxin [Mesorhizobium sp. B2-3-15]TPL79310.1 type II toxin-antitoxin system HipA fam